MATFIAKQLVGKQLDSVKGALSEKSDSGENKADMDPEVEAAIREAEERRQEKHRKIEEERESMRQGIRDKYGLKKKENCLTAEEYSMFDDGKGNKPRKSETIYDEEDSIIGNVRALASRVTETPRQLVTEATDKCSLM